jgi:hypothetical protein
MKTLTLTLITLLCIATISPAFAGAKRDKPNKQKQQQNDTQRGEKLFEKIQDKLGHELTADQKQQITQAQRTMAQDLKPLQQGFLQSIADSLKLSTDEVKQAIKAQAQQPKVKGQHDPAARITAALETHLNRKLTEDESKAITSAIDARKEAAKPIQQKFADELAKITGLSAEDVKTILPRKADA